MFVDTSIVVELLRRPADDPWVQDVFRRLPSTGFWWSTVQYGELADWLRRCKRPVDPVVQRIQSLMNEIPPSRELALQGSALKHEARERGVRDFSLLDGILLASARSKGLHLLTKGKEFRGFPDVEIVTQ